MDSKFRSIGNPINIAINADILLEKDAINNIFSLLFSPLLRMIDGAKP